jgi:hypothetical protein
MVEAGRGRASRRAGRVDSSRSSDSRRIAAAICGAAVLGCGLSNKAQSPGEAAVSAGSAGGAGLRGDPAGGAGSGGHAAGNGGTGTAGSPPRSEFFIEGAVGDEHIVADMDVGGNWFQGLPDGWLQLEARGENVTWFLSVREGTLNQTCGVATITLMREDVEKTTYLLSGWGSEADPCSLAVAEPPGPVGEVIEGTFAGSLSLLAQPGIPTEGSFRVPRIENDPPP